MSLKEPQGAAGRLKKKKAYVNKINELTDSTKTNKHQGILFLQQD